jgi:2-polyprenyl-6-methoxyphenol hydroxylase-like FAD-dependent oxidoreductase
MPQVGKHAVVIGAGIAGLAAGRAVADFFEKVTVLERDVLPESPVPRAGVPQDRHLHVLLAGGHRALEELFPGFERSLVEAGAVTLRVGLDLRADRPGFDPFPRRDLGWDAYSSSRPLVEACVRRLAERHVELRSDGRVERIALSADGARVTGVEFTRGGARETLSADLVIDASGRGALTLAALEASGRPAPPETRIEVDIGYSTGCFRIPEGAGVDWKCAIVYPIIPASSRVALLIPVEGDRWMVTLVGCRGDKPPGDWPGFFAFARGLRTATIARAIEPAEPLGDVERFGFPASVWRHFEKLPDLPRGLLPIGDTICRFNPIYGQGMSVAAQEACLLRRRLDLVTSDPEPLSTLGAPFLAEIPRLLEGPWFFAATPDLAFPETRGERPSNLAETLKFTAGLLELAAEDPEIHRLVMAIQHQLVPRSALAEPTLRRRVMERVAH